MNEEIPLKTAKFGNIFARAERSQPASGNVAAIRTLDAMLSDLQRAQSIQTQAQIAREKAEIDLETAGKKHAVACTAVARLEDAMIEQMRQHGVPVTRMVREDQQ